MLDNITSSTLEDQYSSGVYIKRNLEIVRGEGAFLFDAKGRRYIDMISGQGATNLGHAHPAISQAVQDQVNTLTNCPEFLRNPIRATYQAALCEAANMERVYLCNSGAEAVEAALKFATFSTGRTQIISTMRGFHGRTLGALSTTWNKHYRAPFTDLIPAVDFVPYNNLVRLETAISQDTAAVIIELVQGEGGVHPAEEDYVQAVRELCTTHGAMLIIDEVQTGFGRTGHLFAHQAYDVRPDLVCLAKSIANGVPMGAVLLADTVGELRPALHGSTFGGNPLACAAGNAVLHTLQNTDLIAQAHTRGAQIIEYFQNHLSDQVVRDIRGRGFMLGIELRSKVSPVLATLQEHGVLALPAGSTVLRLLPPLVIDDETLWHGIHIITEVINNAI